MGDMNGQVAVVTGGTRGIGLAISERLLNRGVTVAAGYATNHDHAREFADKYADRGVSIHQGNVGHNEDVLRVFSEVIGQLGEGLIAQAGHARVGFAALDTAGSIPQISGPNHLRTLRPDCRRCRSMPVMAGHPAGSAPVPGRFGRVPDRFSLSGAWSVVCAAPLPRWGVSGSRRGGPRR